MLGFNLCSCSLASQVGHLAPAASFWQDQEAYQAVLDSNLRLTIAGMVAYLISQYHDVWAFHFWKRQTAGRHLWLRNTASTMVSQLLDTLIFVTIAFYGVIPHLGAMIVGQYLVKLLIALLDTPLVYGLVWLIRRHVPALPLSEQKTYHLEE